ncbi:MAG: histidine kinase [Myxococcota bacterium]
MLGESLSAGASVPSPAPSRPKALFFLINGAGWLAAHFVFFSQEFANALSSVPLRACLIVGVSTLTIAGASSLVRVHHLRLPARERLQRRAVLGFGLRSLALVLPWFAAGYAVMHLVHEHVRPLHESFVEVAPRFAAATLLWAALILARDHWRQARASHQRAQLAEARSEDLRLQSLRGELTPHFLANSLSSLVALIEQKPAEAAEVAEDLRALFRRVLDAGSHDMSTLGDELALAAAYLRCESVRFDDRLSVDIDVAPPLWKLPMPSMLLQPLLENALKHGRRHEEAPHISVRGRLEGRTLTLEVRNAGRLTEPSRDPGSAPPGEGVGLRNVRARLLTLFPQTATLTLAEELGSVVARLSYEPGERAADPAPVRKALGMIA